MSEYQYYEFQAIDRPLTGTEMRELRKFSSRARITPTRFVNEYSWGRFKGDEDVWMEKYFDAFLYVANWGTHVLKLRLPARLLDLDTALEYCDGENVCILEKDGKNILSFVANEEGAGEWIEGEGLLSSIINVREELARGDLRALYLGWLLCVRTGELDDDELEPPVPPGLRQLSESLKSLADFLRIDSDLMDVAAEASVPLEEPMLEQEDVRAWVARLSTQAKDDLLTRLIVEGDHSLGLELLQRFQKEGSVRSARMPATRRTVGELLKAAEAYAGERERLEAERGAEEKARREREARVARDKYLAEIAGREATVWAEIEALIATKQPKKYDRAIALLGDLRDLDARRGKGGDFTPRLDALKEAHAGKPSFLARIRKAGL